MDIKGPGYKRTWSSKKERMTKNELDYIYRQAILLRGVLWFPPQKVVSLKKGRGRKRKEKK